MRSDVRLATADDGPALAALCRRVPLAMAGELFWTDYGADWWPLFGGVGGRHVFVAECGGEIVGLHAVTLVPSWIDGRATLLALAGPTRIDPAVQGTGVFRALHAATDELIGRADAEPCALVPVTKGGAHRLPMALRRWPVRYERLVVDCAGVAKPDGAIRYAALDEAGALIDGTYCDAAITPADHAADLARRVSTEPHRYGPDRLLTNGDAVVGVAKLAVGVAPSEARRFRRQVAVLDIAGTSSAALDALVRGWCARLADDGIDDLIVWACTRTLVHDALAPLASTAVAHALDLALTPSTTAFTRGIHFDASLL